MQRKYLSGYRTNEGKALEKKKLSPICSLARGAIPVSSRSRGRRPAHGAIPGLLAGGTSPADLARRGTEWASDEEKKGKQVIQRRLWSELGGCLPRSATLLEKVARDGRSNHDDRQRGGRGGWTEHGCAEDGDDILHVLGETNV